MVRGPLGQATSQMSRFKALWFQSDHGLDQNFCLYPPEVWINKIVAVNCKCFLAHQFLLYVLGAQKNRLIVTVLLSTHNIWFG